MECIKCNETAFKWRFYADSWSRQDKTNMFWGYVGLIWKLVPYEGYINIKYGSHWNLPKIIIHSTINICHFWIFQGAKRTCWLPASVIWSRGFGATVWGVGTGSPPFGTTSSSTGEGTRTGSSSRESWATKHSVYLFAKGASLTSCQSTAGMYR